MMRSPDLGEVLDIWETPFEPRLGEAVSVGMNQYPMNARASRHVQLVMREVVSRYKGGMGRKRRHIPLTVRR
jgi:hypothetical protein